MKRFDFSKESEIIGVNFKDYIMQYGGKAAGLFLAKKIFYDESGYSLLPDSPIIPVYVAFRTDLYNIAERILKEKGD